MTLPDNLRPLFWDVDFDALDPERHAGFLCDRVLASGSWEQISWLRRAVGQTFLRDHLRQTHGRRLARPQVRLWQLLLDLPDEEVSAWLRERDRLPWDARAPGTAR